MVDVSTLESQYIGCDPLFKAAAVNDLEEVAMLGHAARQIYSSDLRADPEAVYRLQTSHSLQNFDENLFQVSVRVVGSILQNLDRSSPQYADLKSRFLSGEVFALAVTSGLSSTVEGPVRESVKRVDDAYQVLINKRMIGGLAKADTVICFVEDGKYCILFEAPVDRFDIRTAWAHGPDMVFDFSGQVVVPNSKILATDSPAKCILETALLEERDGLDAMNFVRRTWQPGELDDVARIEVLACRCAQKYCVFAPSPSLMRAPLILALKLITAEVVNKLALQYGEGLNFADLQKAFSFSIAGGKNAYVEDQIWLRRKEIYYMLSAELKKRNCEVYGDLIRLIRILEDICEQDFCASDRDYRKFAAVLAHLTLCFALLTLHRTHFRSVGQKYLATKLPNLLSHIVEILGARIYDEGFFASREIRKLCNK